MSGSVTVPGTGGSTVRLTFGTGDILHLASQIGALLASLNGTTKLTVTDGSFGTSIPAAPVVPPATVNELIITGTVPGSTTVPLGYNYVIDNNGTPTTITGSSLALITGTAGGSYNVSGVSTVAAEGGNNQILASGQYLISTADGNNTVIASGSGTVATDVGSNVIGVSDGLNVVESISSDTVFVGPGLTTVDASGAGALLFGSGAGDSFLSASITGSGDTLGASGSNTSVTTGGSGDVVFGGGAPLSVLDTGTGDTIASGSSPTTVTAGVGSSGLYVFGGSGGLTFVGGLTAATVLSAGGSNSIVGGDGGVVVGASGSASVSGGSGGATIFGTSGSNVDYSGPGALLYAGVGGNETLNAAASTGTADLFALSSTTASIVGGTGTDAFIAGVGSDTFTGGGGSNTFFFLAANTAGAHDYITNLASTDTVGLFGYNEAGSTTSVADGSITLTLSDKTEITFVGVTTLPTNIQYGA